MKMAKLHNSMQRTCNFAHSGDKLLKIGYQSRCPSIPNYGNPDTFIQDTYHVSDDDIKNLLLYGLNDTLIASVWLQKNNHKNIKHHNLHMF
jgi:hypothetical protein